MTQLHNPDNLPRIAYANLITGDAGNPLPTIVADEESADYPAGNVTNWLPFRRWKPLTVGVHNIIATFDAPVTANCWCIYGHTIGIHGGTVQVEYYNGSSWQSFGSLQTPNGTEPLFIEAPEETATQWMLTVDCPSPAEIGVWFLGNCFIMERHWQQGYAQAQLAQRPKYQQNRSRDGQWLASRIEYREAMLKFPVKNLSANWVRTTWLQFMRAAEAHPFFMRPDPIWDPDLAIFATEAKFDNAPPSRPGWHDARLSCRGVIE